MGREIKFRAWMNGDMRIVEALYFYPDGLISAELKQPEKKLADVIAETPDMRLMQYTGLKDKNGVEIYEADIMKLASGCYVVDFSDYSYQLQHRDGQPCRELSSEVAIAFDVVGNIHENPELLEQS